MGIFMAKRRMMNKPTQNVNSLLIINNHTLQMSVNLQHYQVTKCEKKQLKKPPLNEGFCLFQVSIILTTAQTQHREQSEET